MSIERINQSGERITESRRTMLETEELGVSILQDLHQQRETLLQSHKRVSFVFDYVLAEQQVLSLMPSTFLNFNSLILISSPFSILGIIQLLTTCFMLQLHGVDNAIDKSKKVLATMSRRISRNKWIVGSVIGVLVLVIILILYLKL